jgi:hypothetical protein
MHRLMLFLILSLSSNAWAVSTGGNNQEVPAFTSTGIIIFNDAYTKRGGGSLDWIKEGSKFGGAPTIKIYANGHLFKRGPLDPVSLVDCILPSICIIEGLPTSNRYLIKGEIDSYNTWPRKFADDVTCYRGQRCTLSSNGATQAYMWIRDERRGKCVYPKAGEEYYDLLATMIAVKAQARGIKLNPSKIKRRLTDDRIEIVLDKTMRNALNVVLYAAEKINPMKVQSGNKVIDSINKITGKKYKDVMKEFSDLTNRLVDSREAAWEQYFAETAPFVCR